jgi:hypothetical protein
MFLRSSSNFIEINTLEASGEDVHFYTEMLMHGFEYEDLGVCVKFSKIKGEIEIRSQVKNLNESVAEIFEFLSG